jgi:trans-aconitate 2-methyltransferase
MTLEWDAGEYEALSEPHTRWGTNLLERVVLRGDETAVDAGCGTGRVTEILLERLPGGSVWAVDASEAMVEAVGRRFAGEERVRVECKDLLRFEVEEPVDIIFSTATFHWILDHEVLFGRLANVVKPGGRLVAQCGGAGNIARTQAIAEQVMGEDRFRKYFAGWESPWNFADPKTTRARLEAAGFEAVETWLHEDFAEFGSVDELTRFLQTIVLVKHLKGLPETEKQSFAASVATRIEAEGLPGIDFVRLNILATRGGER